METAHEKAGHLGYRKVEKFIKRRFVWPLLGRDVSKYCMSCELCQRVNKTGQRKVPMVERPIITELFEKIAVDIVGPIPMLWTTSPQELEHILCTPRTFLRSAISVILWLFHVLAFSS